MKKTDHNQDWQQRVQGSPPSLRTWTLHWLSAFLALFLLVTSLASSFSLSARPFPANWMDFHLSAGVALLAITLFRIGRILVVRVGNASIPISWNGPALIKHTLLFIVLLVTLTGLPNYQKSPFGRGNYLFNWVSMPTIVRFDHSLHYVVINFHIALSSILLVLLVFHMVTGVRRRKKAGNPDGASEPQSTFSS